MKLIAIVGVVLVLFGVVTLGYQGFTYTKREKIAQIGDVQITQDTEKMVSVPPLAGGISLAAGIVLLAISRMNGKK